MASGAARNRGTVAFQYFAIAPMRDLGLRAGILAAAKDDILLLAAFDVGLFGWMA